jgi:hypothetical protein
MFIALLIPAGLVAQHIDSLQKLGHHMYNASSEAERLEANYRFIPGLVAALKKPHSFAIPFDSLRMVSIQYAPDRSFRIFSWHIQLADGSYRYFGAIQMNTADGSLKLFPLVDHSPEIQQPGTEILSYKRWLGCQYYRIVGLTGAPETYLLLGWKGKSPQTTQKLIDVLHFSNGEPRFGKAVFDHPEASGKVRMIYEYARQATMFLDYEPATNRIVLDHLAPADGQKTGDYASYGPDMSHDAWHMANGRLKLSEDVVLIK